MIETKYCNGRILDETNEFYDLEDCKLFPDLSGAVLDLMERVDQMPSIAEDLQTLICDAEDGDVYNYRPVRSGLVIQTMIAIQEREIK